VRIRLSLLNFITTVLFLAVTMSVALFATPWLEAWLGRAQFGAFRVVIDCQGYLALLELGLGGALAPLLARALGNERSLRQTIAAGVRAYLSVTLLTVTAGLALTPLIPRFVSQIMPATVTDLRRAWIIGMIGFLPLGLVPFRAILEARQQGYRVNLMLMGQSLMITVMSLVLAWSGWGITGQALAGALGTWTFYLVLTFTVLRASPGLLEAVWRLPGENATWRALWALSVPTLLLNLSGRISLMTDNLVIGGMLGAALVTTLFFTQRLAVLAQTLLLGVGSATWASFADLHARGEQILFNQRLVELSGLLAILSAAGLGPIVAYNSRFVALWLGPGFAYGGDIVIITSAFNAFLLGQLTLWYWCFGATGQIQRVVGVSVIASVINLAASLMLTRRLGLAGPLLGTTFASLVVGTWALPWLLKRTYGVSVWALLQATALPFCWGLLYTVGLWWVARCYPPPGWLALAIEMGLAALGFLIFGGAAVLAHPEKRALWQIRLRALRVGRSVPQEVTSPLG
jgi:O-antigen/teichoic acid export membrane protein